MGSGKTVTTLTYLAEDDLVQPVFPALILGPKRVIQSTWPEEPERWGHLKHLRVQVVTGSRKEREAALRVPADLYCMAYDNLDWLVGHCGEGWPFVTVVADELTRLKSFRLRQGGKRAGALGKVAHTRVKRFIGLTGTPAPNGIKDLWGQTWFLDQGERLGRTFSAFEQRWFYKGYDGYSLQPREHAHTEVMERVSDIYLTVQSLQVDEPITVPVYVDLPPDVRRAYDQVEQDLFAEIETIGAGMLEIEASNAAVRLGKCLQIASGAVFEEGGKVWNSLHDGKLDALESIVEEANGMPILVSYAYTHEAQRILKRFKGAKLLDDDPGTIKRWNEGKIPMLLAHPQCLHPSTEVLTEYRGWQRIVDVNASDRVFDGAEFVSHAGCVFSGVKAVTEVFGLKMTLDHRLFVGGKWLEAKSVRNSPNAKREALYLYEGHDAYLGAMLPLRDRASTRETACGQGQPATSATVPNMPGRERAPDDRNAVLAHMEGHEGAHYRSEQPRLQALRRCWAWRIGGLARFSELLPRYAAWLRGSSDAGTRGQLKGVQQGQLPLGLEYGAASEQEQQSRFNVPRPQCSSGRVLPIGGSEPGGHNTPPEPRHDSRSSAAKLPGIEVPEGAEVSEVYDLVDCGPRHRFLVRNAEGEVFISHNSAGHGLNLQDGGNILVFFGLTFNLEHYMQIIERIGPLRQKQSGYDRPVYLYHILARDTFDEVAMGRLAGKRSVQDAVLDYMKRKET